jgi:septal ring factor EnvC (AmiA/AmiB activator)
MKKNEKSPKTQKTDLELETRVLLEAISQQVQVVAEGHGTIIRKLDEHDKKFDVIEKQIGGLKSDVEIIKVAVMDTNQRVKVIEKKIDNHEIRITKLEEKVVV